VLLMLPAAIWPGLSQASAREADSRKIDSNLEAEEVLTRRDAV